MESASMHGCLIKANCIRPEVSRWPIQKMHRNYSCTEDYPQPQRQPNDYHVPQYPIPYPTFSTASSILQATKSRMPPPSPHHWMPQPPAYHVHHQPSIPPSPSTPPPRQRYRSLVSPPPPHRITMEPKKIKSEPFSPPYEIIGDPSLRIYKCKLPKNMMPLLGQILNLSNQYASTLPDQWRTDLYSLTKQDLCLHDVPGGSKLTRPISNYLKRSIATLYGSRHIQVDRNQPHIVKYSLESGHTGVELHHDRCDVTANLVMSRSHEYKGGGTFFPDAGLVIRLEYGEFLTHPGALVHGGMNVTSGTRHLMVMFADLK